MDLHTFLSIIIVLTLAVNVLAVAVIWWSAVSNFRDGDYGLGILVTVGALIITFLVLSMFGLVFGWDFPVNFNIEPYPW